MILGTVVGQQARVNVTLRPPGHPDLEIEFVVDTGFEGALTLPPAAIRTLGLPYLTKISAGLANARNVPTNLHRATILWHGQELAVAVLAIGKRPLLGTALLDGNYLGIDFRDNGDVRIEPRP